MTSTCGCRKLQETLSSFCERDSTNRATESFRTESVKAKTSRPYLHPVLLSPPFQSVTGKLKDKQSCFTHDKLRARNGVVTNSFQRTWKKLLLLLGPLSVSLLSLSPSSSRSLSMVCSLLQSSPVSLLLFGYLVMAPQFSVHATLARISADEDLDHQPKRKNKRKNKRKLKAETPDDTAPKAAMKKVPTTSEALKTIKSLIEKLNEKEQEASFQSEGEASGSNQADRPSFSSRYKDFSNLDNEETKDSLLPSSRQSGLTGGNSTYDDAFVRCNTVLSTVVSDQVDSDGTFLNRNSYLEFLSIISRNDIDYSEFNSLPAAFVNIFFSSACTGNTTASSCTLGRDPVIDVSPTDESSTIVTDDPQIRSDREFFCIQILKTVTTEIETSFQYSIRYSPTLNDNSTTSIVSSCLEQATELLLYDQLASCELPDATLSEQSNNQEDRKLQVNRAEEDHKLSHRNRIALERKFNLNANDILQRSIANDMMQQASTETELDGNGVGSLAYDSTCRYLINVTVSDIAIIDCLPVVSETSNNSTEASSEQDFAATQASEVCGFVQSTAQVTAHQLVEPSETALRLNAIRILRDSINAGELINYLTEPCKVTLTGSS